MKLISYRHQGQPGWGMLTDAGIVALNSSEYPTLISALKAGKLDEIAGAGAGRAISLQVGDIEFLPVITEPGKIFCVGHNYEAQVAPDGSCLRRPS